MIVVDLGLCSPRTRVCLAAVDLTAELCVRLPLDVLNENLTALVLGLYSVFEATAAGAAGQIIVPHSHKTNTIFPFLFFSLLFVLNLLISWFSITPSRK
jgi:hypothetical protein